MAFRRQKPMAVWFIPLLLGVVGFNRVMHSPQFELYRAVDIVQLLGSGVCFGATMVGVIFMFKGSRT